MFRTILWSISTHYSGDADAELLEWIKDWFDHTIGLGPWTMVILIALIIIAIPVSVMVFYLEPIQQLRRRER